MTEDERRAVPVRASGVLLTLWLGRARVRMSSGGLMGRWILMAAIAGASVAFSATELSQLRADSWLTHGSSSPSPALPPTPMLYASNPPPVTPPPSLTL